MFPPYFHPPSIPLGVFGHLFIMNGFMAIFSPPHSVLQCLYDAFTLWSSW
ncbi:unnamed protein product [Penicillium camemberti]|uniref:Str. FM013 n=1 Tax=Penicillium camemberti (strain FM 013) TaxID=1429867 RepID=A0A0G4PRF7_PENC3|nr:unnamed protein product [Penicillium camemberti]